MNRHRQVYRDSLSMLVRHMTSDCTMTPAQTSLVTRAFAERDQDEIDRIHVEVCPLAREGTGDGAGPGDALPPAPAQGRRLEYGTSADDIFDAPVDIADYPRAANAQFNITDASGNVLATGRTDAEGLIDIDGLLEAAGAEPGGKIFVEPIDDENLFGPDLRGAAGRTLTGEPLTPGVNVDALYIDAGLERAKALGYGDEQARTVVTYALQRWARGEEDGADKTWTSYYPGDFTSWRGILAAARAGAATAAPLTPYAGTSGWSGSDTSEERARADDASGRTTERQRIVVKRLGSQRFVDDGTGGHYSGMAAGLTWKELAALEGWHHGQASGVLSVLHKEGVVARLRERRDRCRIYVLPVYVQGRDTDEHGTKRKTYQEGRADLAAEVAALWNSGNGSLQAVYRDRLSAILGIELNRPTPPAPLR